MTNEPTLDQLAELVIQWGESRGILASATPHDQYRKTLEEIAEIGDGLKCGNDEEIMDGIGDSMVTLILLAQLKGWTLQQCLNHSYNIIAKRTGRIVDGIFVKDAPPSDDDLGELDASKACSIDNPECESCS